MEDKSIIGYGDVDMDFDMTEEKGSFEKEEFWYRVRLSEVK